MNTSPNISLPDDIDKELHRIAITTIIYRDDGKFLITKRSSFKKAFPNMWTVPGGGLTIDDYVHDTPTNAGGQWYNTVEKTLRREVTEEVGVVVDKPHYLLDLTFIRPDNIPVLVLSYYAKYVSGEVSYDDSTVDHAWVTAEEAKKYELIDGILEELEMVEALIKNNK